MNTILTTKKLKKVSPSSFITPNTSIPIIDVSFGANPSEIGFNISTKAIAMELTYGSPTSYLSNGIHDCGGATIGLSGGDYLISSPLIIPQNYGNLRIIDGTIRASSSFTPKTSYL